MKLTQFMIVMIHLELFKSTKTYDPQIKNTTSTIDTDFNILRDYIQQFQAGTWPDPNLVIQNTPSPGATDLEFSCND